MQRKATRLTALVAVGLVLVVFQAVAGGAKEKTFLGTPRAQTLIVDNIAGRDPNPGQWNPYAPGTDVTQYHSLVSSPLWEINTSTGKQFPDIASKPIEPLNSSYTKFRIDIRKGIYWNDGVELTAKDVLFTINMLLNSKQLPYGAYLRTVIKHAKLLDQYALELTTASPDAHIQRQLGDYIWGSGFYVLPEHIWKKYADDPLAYKGYPIVGMGPYELKQYDPNGYWFLWERRSDWQRSDVGLIEGKPAPKYVLVRFYGSEQNRVIAGIKHELDVFMPLSPYGWSTLHKRDPYAQAWHKQFPFADMSDPAARGMTFNDSKAPYDKWQVRWALALAINLQQATLSYDGMMRASPLAFPSTEIAEKAIYPKLQSWLEDFSLPDGFKPYNPDYASELVQLLKQKGFTGVPTNPTRDRDLFGFGWWKYDPAEAAKLLESVGFTRNGSGKWLLPDGRPWSISVNTPADFEPEAQAIAGAAVNQWKQFGIDANEYQMNSSNYFTELATGGYQSGAYWPVMFLTPDSSDQLFQFNDTYIVPTGQPAPGDSIRWKSPEATALVKEMQANPPGDPATVNLEIKFLKLWVRDMPMVTMFDSSQLVPEDTYYWTNFPTASDPYNGPWWWWSCFKFILPHLKPTGR